MKKLPCLIMMLLLNSSMLFCQVAVNTTGTNPDPAAMLDVSSNSMGVLVPRLTTVQRTAIPTPPEGLLLFDIDTKSFWYVKNSAWVEITPGSSGWSLTGNAGTDTAVNFIGTTDNMPLKFKVNNQQAGLLDPAENANTGLGYQALSGNTTGTWNTAFGYQALLMNDVGTRNTAIGYASMYSNASGHRNTGIGYASMFSNTTGEGNIAIGHSALFNSNGNNNTATGRYALISNTTGNSNVAYGVSALYNNTTRSNLVAIGDSALYNNGVGAVDGEGKCNTAVGSKALYSNTKGSYNIANGYQALNSNTTGFDNTGYGYRALYKNTTGYENTAIGSVALYKNTTGVENTAVGMYSLYFNTTGVGNIGIGYYALFNNNTGNNNSALGDQALISNNTGNSNTAIGHYAGINLTGGNENIFLGSSSGPPSNQSIDSSMWLGNTRENKPAIFGDLKNGYIGIGTSNPIFDLDIRGRNTDDGAVLVLANSDDSHHLIFFSGRENDPQPFITWSQGDPLKFVTNEGGWSEKMRITSAGQLGVGTTMPDPSAKLELNSTSQGFLPPRLTHEQIGAISYPADGLIVYCTTDDKFYAYVGSYSTWKEILYGTTTISANCLPIIIDHIAGDVAPVTKTVTYGAVTNIPGENSKCWITSNLGSDHQAQSVDDTTEASAGWYWQFNRKQGYKHDGITVTPEWIYPEPENSDWLAENDPCHIELGGGWHIPTVTEWTNVDAEGSWTNWNDPWNSALKLHAAGHIEGGSMNYRGTKGMYVSSSQDPVAPFSECYQLLFESQCSIIIGGGLGQSGKATGFSVRCIRN